jgi:hypothetical protein
VLSFNGTAQYCLRLLRFQRPPQGEYVFLEVNEAGQVLLFEEYTGLPLLNAFCDFLIAADPAFEYGRGTQAPLRFVDPRFLSPSLCRSRPHADHLS